MTSVIKFSQFTAATLSNTTNTLVGASAPSGGVNIKQAATISWTDATRPSSPYAGLEGYNTGRTQWEYWNGSAWVQFAAGGAGTVNSGVINQLTWYAATGTAVSGLNTANSSVLTTTSGGVPIWSATLPASLNIPQPNIVGVTNASNAAAGSVGEFMSSVVAFSSAVTLSQNVATNQSNLSLTAGDWDVWISVFFSSSVSTTSQYAGISTTSSALPDNSLLAGGAAVTSGTSSCFVLQRLNVSTTTPVYAVVFANGAGTKVCGGIYARRIR